MVSNSADARERSSDRDLASSDNDAGREVEMASLDSVHSEVERGGMIVVIDVLLIGRTATG